MLAENQALQNDKKLESKTKIQMAKKELNSIQEKFRRFKQKSRENTQRQNQSRIKRDSNVPTYTTAIQNQSPLVPNLKRYFSFMMQKENQPVLDNVSETKRKTQQMKLQNDQMQRQKINFKQKLEKQQRRSIQDKLSQQKNIAINNLEQFFANKKSQLDAKAIELQQAKAKAIQDINLLKRNNTQIQTQIQIQKNMIYNNATESLKLKNKQILQKIQNKKKAIENLKSNVQKINSRKQQLKRNINECLKGNKNFIAQETLTNEF